MFAAVMLLALLIDRGLGWPDAVFQRIGHPVTWIGRIITILDSNLNTPRLTQVQRKLAGVVVCGTLVVAVAGLSFVVQSAVLQLPLGAVLVAVLAWPLIAARSLADHVAAVATALDTGGVEAGRASVAMIVGRDPSALDEAGVARAAIESLAENASDGVVAPLFWGVVLGLPGIAAYKTINTLDSMIGYRTEKHAAFGWASARLDDVVNYVPARLTAVLFAVAGGHFTRALKAAQRDAGLHRSPNAGWPEAAMAAALNIRLSGPRAYHGTLSDDPWVHPEGQETTPDDINRALRLYGQMLNWGMALLVLLTLFGATA